MKVKCFKLFFRFNNLPIVKQILLYLRLNFSKNCMLSIIALSLTLYSFAQPSHSFADQESSQTDSIIDWRSGFEIEISERHFAKIIDYFDLSFFETSFDKILNSLIAKINQEQPLTPKEMKVLKILNATIDWYFGIDFVKMGDN